MNTAAPAPMWSLPLLLLVAACATDDPAPSMQFSGERIDVRVLGDGFVMAARGRVPLEAFVLELRQRLRQLPTAARQELWVHMDVDANAGQTAAQQVAWLRDQLQAIGITQIDYL